MIFRQFSRALAGGIFTALLATCAQAADAPPSVDKLTEKLASKDREARREAAYQLSHLGKAAKPALPALIKALDDDDKQIWSDAIATIAALGPDAQEAIPVLLDRLDGRKNRGRQREQRQGVIRTAYALSRIGVAVVPPLVQALGENDSGLKIGATRALGGMGPMAKDAVPALIKNLADGQEPVRDETSQALGSIGSVAGPALIAALQDPEAKRRAGAAAALAQMDPAFRDGAKDVEQAEVKETDVSVRGPLLAALIRTGVPPDRCVALILPALTDENEALRHAALNALLNSSAVRKAAVPKLAPLLADSNPAVRERAAHALARIGPAAMDAMPALLAAARSSGGAQAYADAVTQLGPQVLPTLFDLLQAGKPEDSKWVPRILHDFGPPAVPALSEALKSNCPEVRVAAATALGQIGPDAAAASSPLFVLTKDSSAPVQAAAFRGLVAIHADSARLKPLLQEAMSSKDADVSKAAAAGLAALGGASQLGVNGLVGLLSGDDAPGRLAAVQSLGQLGAAAAPAVEPLLAHIDDPALRMSVIESLGQIGPAAASAVPRLVKLAEEKNTDQLMAIMITCTAIGPGGKDALPLIYASVRHQSIDVCALAVTALANVETDDAKAIAIISPLAHSSVTGPVHRAAVKALAKYKPSANAGQARGNP
ncbi:MAG: HEAT repeat domain-containing protein [Chthoniobacter sp.]